MERKEFKRHLRRLSIIPFILLLAVASALCFQIFRQQLAARSVDQADKAISETTHVIKLLVDMETGFRGYLLSGQLLYLEPYQQAVGSIHSELTALKKSVPNQEVIVPRLNQLEVSINSWSGYANNWIQKRQSSPRFQPPFVDAEGKTRMDEMRNEIQDILKLQQTFRDDTTVSYDHTFRSTISAIFLLSFLAATLIALSSQREARWLANRFEKSIEAARKEGEQYRAIFEGAKDYGISLLDPTGTIERWNPGAEQLTGYIASEIVGKSITSIYTQEELAQRQLQTLLGRAEELGKYETEAWSTRKDGTKFWSDIVVTALREVDGTLRGYSSIFRDHSKRKQIEQERAFLIKKLQEGIQSRDDFLMMASHELKTPMTSVTLQLQFIKLAAQQQGSASKVYPIKAELIDTFHRQIARMNKLIEMMLDVARIHSGSLPLEFKPTQLSDLVQNVVKDHVDQFQAAGCPLNVSLEPNITIECDAFRIEQAVVNLLTNALRFGCVDTIHVTLKSTKKTAIFSVRDAGPGIPKEHQERIFQRYGRVEGIHDQGGLGLGLYISKEFIEAHNGKISVESEPGRGATFTIELPLEQMPSA